MTAGAGFDPKGQRHVTQFNLTHPDSFQTLTPEESSALGAQERP